MNGPGKLTFIRRQHAQEISPCKFLAKFGLINVIESTSCLHHSYTTQTVFNSTLDVVRLNNILRKTLEVRRCIRIDLLLGDTWVGGSKKGILLSLSVMIAPHSVAQHIIHRHSFTIAFSRRSALALARVGDDGSCTNVSFVPSCCLHWSRMTLGKM